MKNYFMALTAKRYTITAALPYTNGPIHIGHLAGVYVPADIYSRYLRAQKKDVAFICGSDEHGVAISIRAKKEGVSPKEIIDKYDGMIRKSFDQLGISFDNYSRTSAPIHHETASDIFSKMHTAGQFVEEVTEQLYDPEAKQYLADRFVTGTCPKCNHTEAYGDQCEQCGSSLNATELINPKSTLSGAEPILKETKHWFLPLDQYEDFMKEWVIEGHKEDWKPNVYGQVKSWVDEGLRPRAVTRDLDWGIPVPVEGADGKVLYVWFDAPIGYISSTKEWAAKNNKDWEPYWKDKETSLVHFIGKDNIVFHCIIFPCILKAAGDYILPENVPANEFLNLEGNKISTSKNWAVWLHEYLEEFPGQEDVLRYVLTANAPETKDNDFTWKDFQARNNNELVAIFGNFINRVSVLTQKYYDGSVPARKNQTPEDKEALEKMKAFPAIIGDSIERFRFREASQELMNLARLGNKYLADQEPWKIIKIDPTRVETIMNIALQIAATLATVSEPFLPHSAQKLRTILNITNPTEWNAVATTEDLLVAGHVIGSQELLFAKVEDSSIQAQLERLQDTKKNNAEANFELTPVKENISFDQFNAMDLRTGTVIEAEKIKKTKKLLNLKVDLGFEIRTIVSGIAESYTPEEMIGKKVTVLANLASRTIKGVESQGMLLMTENKEGKLIVIGPEDASIDNGFEIN
ncbi:methionine--tRNA ligase [Flavobacteriaceae bacterium]|nr:methionine--tRNA ligase [Flavobacteriaceae bacterium]MDB9899723.1 methionine--tRNA ligase [Flavobacteriaceae bacterium]